ncbi:hypothetical protein NWO25_10735 [Enterococcus lactis]|nr:hypothetical protein [Enterococcus lactis]
MKQTGDELEEIFIGDQTEYVVAVDLSENTAVPEINGSLLRFLISQKHQEKNQWKKLKQKRKKLKTMPLPVY